MPANTNLRAVGDRIEALTAEAKALGDARAREAAEELVRLLVDFYGGGLERILEVVDDSERGGELIDRLADDPLVASLLLLHGLHPLDAETRIVRALDKVRPYLGSHGGDVSLLGIEDGVVRLRLEGSCNGCSSSAITMKLAIERAIEEAAPEVAAIEVEGVIDPLAAPAATAAMGDSALVQIGSPEPRLCEPPA